MDSYLYSSIILNLIRLVLDTINLYNIEPLRTTLCLELTKPPSVRLIFKQCDQVRSLLAYDKLSCSQTFFEDDCIECGKEIQENEACLDTSNSDSRNNQNKSKQKVKDIEFTEERAKKLYQSLLVASMSEKLI